MDENDLLIRFRESLVKWLTEWIHNPIQVGLKGKREMAQQYSDDDYTAVQRSPDDPFLTEIQNLPLEIVRLDEKGNKISSHPVYVGSDTPLPADDHENIG